MTQPVQKLHTEMRDLVPAGESSVGASQCSYGGVEFPTGLGWVLGLAGRPRLSLQRWTAIGRAAPDDTRRVVVLLPEAPGVGVELGAIPV